MKYRFKSLLLISVSTGALMLPLSAHALLASCTASLVGAGIAFGSYASPGSANSDSTGTVRITCNGVGLFVSYTVTLGTGSGSYANRTLKSGANFLNYNMYVDATRLQVWGNGNAGTYALGNSYLIGFGPVTNNYTVYGRIPGSQSKPAGTYTDSVIVTVTY
ncbi:Csu type fimbrial protein [Glaciimonas sp. GG7]